MTITYLCFFVPFLSSKLDMKAADTYHMYTHGQLITVPQVKERERHETAINLCGYH